MGGRAVELIRVKTVRKKRNIFTKTPRVDIPAPLLERHRFDDLDTDFFYVQSVPFLLTLTRNIGFQTLQSFTRVSKVNKKSKHITYRRGKSDIITGLTKVYDTYQP